MAQTLLNSGFDQLDYAILRELQVNGRISVADLARKIHLSAPAVHQRIKRLERAGVIQQYVALLNRETIGYDLLCFVRVSLQPHTRENLDALEAAMLANALVLECYRTAGNADILLKIAVQNHRELDDFVGGYLARLPGVDRIETSLVMGEVKTSTPFELK
jgi:Lrp/AsnC family leucine-responsive transcriptional regulator